MTAQTATMIKDAAGNLAPQYYDEDLDEYVVFGPNDKITHQSIPWASGGVFSAASTTYKFSYAILNPKAKRRMMMVRNGLNQNIGNVQFIVLDTMGGALTFAGDNVDPSGSGTTTYFVNSNFNALQTISSQMGANNVGVPVANVPSVGGGAWAIIDAPGDTLHLEVTTGGTAPTGGSFDVWIREVGINS